MLLLEIKVFAPLSNKFKDGFDDSSFHSIIVETGFAIKKIDRKSIAYLCSKLRLKLLRQIFFCMKRNEGNLNQRKKMI